MKNLLIPFLCSALSFPLMPFERKKKNGHYGPIPPENEKLVMEIPNDARVGGSIMAWYHNMKNISTEYIRADCQYWSKFLSFIILIQLILLFAL